MGRPEANIPVPLQNDSSLHWSAEAEVAIQLAHCRHELDVGSYRLPLRFALVDIDENLISAELLGLVVYDRGEVLCEDL